jgi:cytochrome P450
MTKARLVFDPFSQEFYDNPIEIYREVREQSPVYYSEQYDFYALTRHEDVAAAFKDFETYSSAYGTDLSTVQSGEQMPQTLIIFMDPPNHRHMRSLLNKIFTPRAIQSQAPLVSDKIDKYLGAIEAEQFDVVQDFAAPFPVEVMTTMLGVPDEHAQQVRMWIDESLRREPGEVAMGETGMKASIETAMFYLNLLQERRADPRDDLLTTLITAEIAREDGQKSGLNDLEIAGFATLLGGAGAETVTKLISSAVAVFARNPEQWQKLFQDRSKIPAAVEELLRYEGPVQYNVRRSLKEVTLHGVTIPAGKPVFLMGGSANRDPAAWTDPDVFDIDRDRTEAQNIGLGYGIHSCLGAALARMETAIAIDKLLDFMPRYQVDWDNADRVTMQNVVGWHHLPVRILR